MLSYEIILVLIIVTILESTCKMSTRMMMILIGVAWVLITGMVCSDAEIQSICNKRDTKTTATVVQTIDGAYLYVDMQLNKIKPDKIIISDNNQLITTDFKQRNKILDTILADFTTTTLYVDINNVTLIK